MLNHPVVAAKIGIERGVLQAMDGGCQLPLGVFFGDDKIHVAHAANSNEPAKFFQFGINAGISEIVSTLNY
jgi:hydroxymethylbilane synthase